MMRISTDRLRELAKVTRRNCMTLAMPLHGDDGTNRDAALLRSLMHAAGEALQLRGVTVQEKNAMLEPPRSLLRNFRVASALGGSFLAFLADGVCECFRVADRLDPIIAVDEQFQAQALIHLVAGTGDFCIFCFSPNAVRLLAVEEGCVPVEIPLDVADTLKEFVQLQAPPDQFSGQACTRQGVHAEPPSQRRCHPPGTACPGSDFLAAVAKAVTHALRSRRTPVLLVGDSDDSAALRQELQGCEVVDRALVGCADGETSLSLLRRAEPVMVAYRRAVNSRFARDMLDRPGSRVTFDLEEIRQAAVSRQVSALFIDPAEAYWRAKAGGRLHSFEAVIRSVLRYGGQLLPITAGALSDGACLMAALLPEFSLPTSTNGSHFPAPALHRNRETDSYDER